ncbi:hypothetical protein GGTG_03966 [Gaeumannomyces tritici R3-111a-1]|uniref:Uncharacterized protein n=1 Tax=Gaeumannomyces tritici (strain R3-111a-1) TaxID=644352 RepID=J3NRR6_GAET3|nr:hypothetical protein GGTG_03966 [Gaeumannomyces tritici R3-111a-1]EJT78872.1 hypothetical protein GGTG_03966 [Gaeumannomyces tritici R3-111a-1]
MSNNNVGAVYEKIIENVLESSTVDFEESGIDLAVMQELKQVWQQRLSAMQVASFPWDPKPDPPPAPQPAAPPADPPPVASYTQATLSPPTGAQAALPMPMPMPMPAPQAPPSNGMYTNNELGPGGDAVVKQEHGSQPNPMIQHYPGPAHGAPGAGPTSLAQQRAVQQLANQYGQRAAASINALKTGPPAQGQRPHLPLPAGQAPQNAEQYRQQMQAQQQAQQAQRAQQPNGSLGPSQVDGPAADDDGFEGVMCQREQDGSLRELGRVDIDRMMHRQMTAAARRMEGGGLMVPLKEATKHSKRAGKMPETSVSSARPRGLPQVDGADNDMREEDLDDAINSDLDDPEDDLDDSDEDGDEGQQMLCLYDKVQRVKNKWKCTLKDGILTVNGKEYVFHKATGEYEW